jgi:hypothetical protein
MKKILCLALALIAFVAAPLQTAKADPLFLFVATGVIGIAFANEGGHECIEDNGVKECVKGMLDQGTDAPLNQERYRATTNQ